MKKRLLIICCLAVGFTLPLLVAGCNRANAAGSIGQRQPPTGRNCTVQFRRDFLGTARDLPVSPTIGSINGAETSVQGKLTVVTDEWIVLDQTIAAGAQPVERELWIPRDAVLLLQISPK